MRKNATLALFALLSTVVVVAVALAQVERRPFMVDFVAGRPILSYSASTFADAAVRRQLATGLTQTLLVRTYAYEVGSSTPLAVAARSCRVTFDPWPQNFRVEEQTDTGDRNLVLPTLDSVITHCLVVERASIGAPAVWAAHPHARVTFGVVVELNPLTPDGVQRIRRWLARPEGGASPDDAFFGSFVSLFVNRGIGAAERTLSFSSQEVACP